MTIATRPNGTRISSLATQKEIENHLFTVYGIPRKQFRQLVKEGREKGYIWNDITAAGRVITIYLVPRYMWIGSRPETV